MKIGELYDILTGVIESGEVDRDAEVTIMYQENYPLECSVGGLCLKKDVERDNEDENEDLDCGGVSDDGVCGIHGTNTPGCVSYKPSKDLIIVTGSHIGYGTKRAWDQY